MHTNAYSGASYIVINMMALCSATQKTVLLRIAIW